MAGRRLPPHATFGVKVMEKVPQVEPLHLQPAVHDPAAEQRRVYLVTIHIRVSTISI